MERRNRTPIGKAQRLRILSVGAIALATALHPAPSDGMRPRLPDLLTKDGPVKWAGSIREEIQGGVDILLTGMPMTGAEIQLAYDARGVHLLHIATAVTAIVPCYNLSGLQAPLNFSARVLARIFLGKITKWNDPAIAALNRSAHLPAAGIVLIGHAGEDGSTYAWTDFLSQTDAGWRQSIGRVRSLAAQPAPWRGRNPEDVAAAVERVPNSIAFTELWAAKGRHLQIGRVRNRSGNFIEASPASMSAAAGSAAGSMLNDFRTSIADTGGAADYPISSLTWIVVPDPFPNSEKRSAVTSFLKWVLTDGQNSLESAHLGRLPSQVCEREIRLVDAVR